MRAKHGERRAAEHGAAPHLSWRAPWPWRWEGGAAQCRWAPCSPSPCRHLPQGEMLSGFSCECPGLGDALRTLEP